MDYAKMTSPKRSFTACNRSSQELPHIRALFQRRFRATQQLNFMGLDFFADSTQRSLQDRKSLKCICGRGTIFCGQLFYRLETRRFEVRKQVMDGKALDHESISLVIPRRIVDKICSHIAVRADIRDNTYWFP